MNMRRPVKDFEENDLNNYINKRPQILLLKHYLYRSFLNQPYKIKVCTNLHIDFPNSTRTKIGM
jgi:hypothetical protein